MGEKSVNTDAVNMDADHKDPVNMDAGHINAEEYRGPAILHLDDGPFPVEIRMSAYFEPIEGRFRWAGRTGRHDMLRERAAGGLRTATITVAGSPETTVKLGDPDPWGGVRLSGTGTPPWYGGTGHDG